jgi:2-C-methyl-D-erythritol 2,4-cyclodiphosphate synthase
LTHALCDALLGALGLGDIGRYYPDTDDKFKGVNSLLLLGQVEKMLEERNYRVVNTDVTVIAQEPKLWPFIDVMRENLSKVLKTVGKISTSRRRQRKRWV